jgi:hypothetical protein
VVIKAGHTDRASSTHALEQVEVVGGRTIGVVLNDPDGAVRPYGYPVPYYRREAVKS